MKPKGRIHKHADGRWGYYRRAFGFGKAERRTFKTWREAMAYATNRMESSGGLIDFASSPADAIAPIPRWHPFGDPPGDRGRRA